MKPLPIGYRLPDGMTRESVEERRQKYNVAPNMWPESSFIIGTKRILGWSTEGFFKDAFKHGLRNP